jgi:hypothetical protein
MIPTLFIDTVRKCCKASIIINYNHISLLHIHGESYEQTEFEKKNALSNSVQNILPEH